MGLAALELDAEFKFHFAEVLNGDKAQPAVMKPSLKKSLKKIRNTQEKQKFQREAPKNYLLRRPICFLYF